MTYIEQRIRSDNFIYADFIEFIHHLGLIQHHENNFEAYFNKSIFEGADIALIAAVK